MSIDEDTGRDTGRDTSRDTSGDSREPHRSDPGRPQQGGPGDDAVLRRAVGVLHDEPDTGWEEASAHVRRSLRQATRRARRLTATTTDLPTGFGPADRLEVSERVVLDALRRAVSTTAGVAPVAIVLHVEHQADGHDCCTGVRLDLVVGYGTALTALTGLRAAITRTLDELLGPATWLVDLDVVDVEADDPTP